MTDFLTNSPGQKALFTSLYASFGPDARGRVSSIPVANLLRTAGLQTAELRKIWALSCAEKDSLNQEELNLCLSYVIACQNGLPLEPSSLARVSGFGLPAFNLKKPERIESSAQVAPEKSLSSRASLNENSEICARFCACLPELEALARKWNAGKMPQRLENSEARDFFSRSKNPDEILAHIWRITARGKNFLNQGEILCAIFLLEKEQSFPKVLDPLLADAVDQYSPNTHPDFDKLKEEKHSQNSSTKEKQTAGKNHTSSQWDEKQNSESSSKNSLGNSKGETPRSDNQSRQTPSTLRIFGEENITSSRDQNSIFGYAPPREPTMSAEDLATLSTVFTRIEGLNKRVLEVLPPLTALKEKRESAAEFLPEMAHIIEKNQKLLLENLKKRQEIAKYIVELNQIIANEEANNLSEDQEYEVLFNRVKQLFGSENNLKSPTHKDEEVPLAKFVSPQKNPFDS